MTLHHGDCLEVMPTLEAESIDAIVTDPPYGLGFMGKAWDADFTPGDSAMRRSPQMDAVNTGASRQGGRQRAGVDYQKRQARDAREYQSWCERWAVEAFRVAKPGAHLLAFGGTRTYHRLAAAIEDAGWEIRDSLVWAYASGFPKSLDVSKAIDKAAGAERERGGTSATSCPDFPEPCSGYTGNGRYSPTVHALPTLPATDAAREWQGWGTALKPAWEPIVLARKPLRGTVAANVTEHGTGALNIDGCRIGYADAADLALTATKNPGSEGLRTGPIYGGGRTQQRFTPSGRWPANVILTDPIFDGDIPGVVGGGEAGGSGGTFNRNASIYGQGEGIPLLGVPPIGYGDSGTYSRFFLIPKADRADREPVLGGLPQQSVPNYQPTVLVCECGERWKPPDNGGLLRCNHPREMYRYEAQPLNPRTRANVHPTVKPTDLMRHLVRLVTPPGGVVLDPFLGSGTTALACELEGFGWVGIEREAEYVAIAEARLNGTQRGLGLVG